MSDEKILHRIAKNNQEEIIFRIYRFKNRDYFDIRTYISVVGEVDKVPTKKGVSFKLDQIDDAIKGLMEIKKTIEEGIDIS